MASLELEALEQHICATSFEWRGERIGRVDEVYVNEATADPGWGRVPVGPLRTPSTLVPVDLAVRNADLLASHDKTCVEEASGYLDPNGTLPPGEEAQLFQY